METERAVLAGGCFWGMQDLLRNYEGVISTRVGYTGGTVANATYQRHDGHAEAIEILFDPKRIDFRQLLEIFFQIHDPTTRNRQGNDVGPQYRSGIYTHNEEQAAVAREVLAEVNAAQGGRAVTELMPEANYWRAEDYHQHYFANHPGQGYCAFVVAPKVEKFRKTFKERVRAV